LKKGSTSAKLQPVQPASSRQRSKSPGCPRKYIMPLIALPPPMVRPAISAPDCVKTRVAMVR